MKKFLLALLTAATAAALLCGAAAVSTYSVGYDAPAGIITIVVQDSSAAVVLQAADIDHIHADYTYTSSLSLIHTPSPRDGLLSRMPSSA